MLPDIFMYLFLSIGPLGIAHSLSRKQSSIHNFRFFIKLVALRLIILKNSPQPSPPKKKLQREKADKGNKPKEKGIYDMHITHRLSTWSVAYKVKWYALCNI